MPTKQPLDDGDDAEGQLNSIAAFSAPVGSSDGSTQSVTASSATPPRADAGQSAPMQSAAAPARPMTAASAQMAVHRGPLRTTLRTPGVSLSGIRNSAGSAGDTVASSGRSVAKRAESFTKAALDTAWDKYAIIHHDEQVLANTMRASHPVVDEQNKTLLHVTVENNIQVEKVREAMPRLLQFLRNELQNDNITINVQANTGEAAPYTWNDRRVLSDILEHRPLIKALVDELSLKL